MKRIAICLLSIMVVASLVLGASIAMAAKPQDVIERSNGFPSGPHFNLNIHGKKADFNCDPTSGGGSVFILEDGDSTIQYVTNKKSSVTELKALDRCAEAFDGDPAKVQLPYEEKGYYVFARILGKPNNGKDCTDPEGDCPSAVLLYPNVVIQACNDDPNNPDPDFGDYTDCDDALWALGLIAVRDLYDATPEGFVRFDDSTESKGKGKSKAKDITRLFTWSGWVCDAASPDSNGDGVIDENDVPADAISYVPDLDGDGAISVNEWIAYHPDSNGDGVIDESDVPADAINYVPDLDSDGIISVEEWLIYQETLGNCTHYDNEWIFNIADLVVTEQPIQNDGTKLLQVRFYPVATTEYTQ